MKKEEFKVGVKFTRGGWGKTDWVEVKYADEAGVYGVDEDGLAWYLCFRSNSTQNYSIIPKKKKVWLDGDDLPQVFLVRFEGGDANYTTISTCKVGFTLMSSKGFFYNYTSDRLENAEWSPITEINWQKFYKYE